MRAPGFLPRLGVTCLTALLLTLPLHSLQAQTPADQRLGANRVADTAAAFARRTTLAGHRPAWAVPNADRGALPDSQNVELIFALTRAPEVQAAFEQLLADQQNPASPRYDQWLTPQQVGAQFGPTQHDLDALTTWLTGQGFSVRSVTPSRIFVQVSAPAAIVSSALGTNLHTWQVSYGAGIGTSVETMQAPTAEPSLPVALAPLVAYIGGLTSVPLHTHAHLEPHTASNDAASVHPSLTSGSGNHYLTPLDFNKIYDVPSTLNATGQKVMIVGGSRLNPSDLSLFESNTALAAYSPNTIVDPAYADPGQTNDGNQGEATLDFERVYGTAAGVQVDLVIAANWLNGTVNQNLILYAINTVNDPVMSLSFGACENLQPAGYVKQEDAMYSQAASQGITTLVSSGDAGVTGCAVHGVAATAQYAYANINDVCASSYVTCVGGTEFIDTVPNPTAFWSATNGTGFESATGYIPEGAWNEPNNAGSNAASVPYVVAATGGGPSTVIAKPVWQTGTGVPADGARDTPDISFSAAGHDGYFSCLASASTPSFDTSCTHIPNASGTGYSFGFVAFSGTSASAPSMAGVAALLDARLGARQGNINPALYKLAASTPAAFHDSTLATSGLLSCSTATPSVCNNSTPGPTTLTGGVAGYQLQTGYDLITGLGSLDINAFLAAAAPASTGTVTLTPATTALTASAGTAASDTLTLTSINFSGSVSLSCSVAFAGTGSAGVLPGCSLAPASATFTGSGTSTSTLTITSAKRSIVQGVTSSSNRLPSLRGAGSLALCALLALWIPRRTRKALGRLQVFSAAALLALTLGVLSGCGNNNFSGGTPASGTSNGTAAGTYTITVTASGSSSVVASTSISLTIQ